MTLSAISRPPIDALLDRDVGHDRRAQPLDPWYNQIALKISLELF
jgi:hypothetical protein